VTERRKISTIAGLAVMFLGLLVFGPLLINWLRTASSKDIVFIGFMCFLLIREVFRLSRKKGGGP
jgi:hypothetical protein